MNKININGYNRITKAAARRAYNAGETVRICPVNISPVNMYGLYADCSNAKHTTVAGDGFNTTIARNKEFETIVNAFIYYNCNHETGYYPAYYVREV